MFKKLKAIFLVFTQQKICIQTGGHNADHGGNCVGIQLFARGNANGQECGILSQLLQELAEEGLVKPEALVAFDETSSFKRIGLLA